MAKRYSSSFFLRVLRRSRALPLLTLVALIAPMFPRFAWADGNVPAPAGQAGVYPASLGIPETGAAVTNGASLASVDPATGTAHTSIPFQLPNARGRSQPSLGLTYSSSAGVGVGGWGWSMTVPSIQRTPLSGPPTYADPDGGVIDPTVEDRFSFEGQPLVPICTIPYRPCDGSLFLSESNPENFPSVVTTGWSYFRLETGGADGRFFWSPDHNTWLVQYKSGETLELGMALGDVPANAAIDWDHDQPTKAFRWNIVKQYDSERSGTVPANLISYSWAAQTGGALDSQLYLTDVYDTLAPSAVATGASAALTSAAHHVRLYYEYQNKAPAAPTFVPPIWRSTPRYVLSHVDVTAAWPPPPAPGGTTSAPSSAVQRRLVRRYWFGYTADTDASDSNRIELTSVQVEGRCPTATTDLENAGVVSPTSNCPMLPKTQYGYEPAFATLTPTPLSGQLLPQASGYSTYVLDMNSDGIPDIVTMNPATTVGTTYLVSAVEADTLGSVQPLTAVYPTGASASITPPSTEWTAWAAPASAYVSDIDAEGFQSPPSFAFPGNWAANGSINELVPENSADAGAGASASYSILSPSTNENGTVLSGTQSATIKFWQTSVNATCCSGKNTKYVGYSMYAENVYGIVDVDGDGLQDAITDTPVRMVTTQPETAYDWMPYVHFLSLRTTMQGADGTIAPFARAAPNNVSKIVPPSPEAAQLAASASAGLTSVPVLPADGQYVAEVVTANYQDPAIRLLGDADWNEDPVFDVQDSEYVSTFMQDMNGDGLVDWVTLNTQWAGPATVTAPAGNQESFSTGLLYWVGHGDGTFGSCASGKNDCTGSARFAGAGAATSMLRVPPILETSIWVVPPTPTPGNTTFLMHDVTGDGFPDLLVMTTTGMTLYINEYGSGFDGGNPVAAGAGGGAVPVWNGTGQVFFGDMNGSGVDDIIVIQGTSVYYVDVESGLRPGLLTSITNGYGATTTLTYQILHHVTKVVSTNGFAAGASTPFAETRTVDYAYAEPIYDGRDVPPALTCDRTRRIATTSRFSERDEVFFEWSIDIEACSRTLAEIIAFLFSLVQFCFVTTRAIDCRLHWLQPSAVCRWRAIEAVALRVD